MKNPITPEGAASAQNPLPPVPCGPQKSRTLFRRKLKDPFSSDRNSCM